MATYSLDDLKTIVTAGLTVAEAKALLDEGWEAADVLELAERQAAQRVAAASAQQTATAKAMQKAMRPENEFHPGHSALSYPEGDHAKPRTLPYEFWINNYPCHKFPETEHWREIDLMRAVTPGVFTALRKDGSRMTVTVTAERDADGRITKMKMEYPVSRDEKHLIPPKIVLLYQIAHAEQDLRVSFMQSMQEFMAMTMGTAVPAGA